MKKAYFFAGVNGAGKTTLYFDELEKNKDFGLRINIDEIVRAFGDPREPLDQLRAGRIALKMRQNYVKKGLDFNQESTLCGSAIKKLFEKLRFENYEIFIFYVGLESAELAKERVRARVAKGGHDIDDKIIEKRYLESFENLNKIFHLCDEIWLYDNSFFFKKLLYFKDQKKEVFAQASWLKYLNF